MLYLLLKKTWECLNCTELVSLITRLVACSARIAADRQTDTQNDYCNPRCACAPRVNKHHSATCLMRTSVLGHEVNESYVTSTRACHSTNPCYMYRDPRKSSLCNEDSHTLLNHPLFNQFRAWPRFGSHITKNSKN